MVARSGIICFALIASAVLGAPVAGAADIEALPPHERVFASPIGSFTVGHKDESVHRIPPLNQVGTTREALVSNTVYGRIDGGATGTLVAGYHVGCAVNLNNGALGLNSSIYPDDVLPDVGTGGTNPIPYLNGQTGIQTYVAPVLTATLAPGEVKEVKLTEKQVVPGDTAWAITRDFHIIVNSCTGPVSIRSYSYMRVTSTLVDDSGGVFGDPTWL
ncbi:MspA family porin [Nocardia otitidiscaviarum]|uniref:MspA family porin n=1 Tax=Nocardia otitidiscaviarum TaxID=1823 RepID=UPI000694F8CD|nr:MspA family porin [Nocardia otitidiscaviarum]